MRNARLVRAAVAAALLGATVGCTSAPAKPAAKPGARPTFAVVACPDDVEVLVVPQHQCGYVTPLEGGPLKIFVVTVEPPEPSDLSPVLETGVDLGMTPTYGGLAPIAQRTGRRLVIVDLPGTGHSEPSLACPEVDGLGDAAAGTDEAALVTAIEDCRARVDADGIDTGMVAPERLGEALYDVMVALDVPEWVVMGHGTTAEAGRQVALAHPDLVEALILDSAVTDPQADVEQVVEDVARACRADVTCVDRYGDPATTWARATARLARRPMDVDVNGSSISIDDATLERAVRWLVAPADLGPQQLPALLAEAASGHLGANLYLFAATLAVAPPLCVGYVPKCRDGDRLVMGATLSTMCPTVADMDAWSAACAAWGVPASASEPQPLSGVPTMALLGSFDPFAAPTVVRERLAELAPDAFVVEQAPGGHNVLGSDCPRSVRNDWLAGDVHQPPPALPCLSDPVDF